MPLATLFTDMEKLGKLAETRTLNVLFSGCLIGVNCGWEGDNYQEDLILKIHNNPKIKPIKFCPEDYSFGTPREFCSIHGGDGFDVLDGKAKLMTVTGVDWTAGALRSAERIVQLAKENKIDFAIMMDISPSCGSSIIYKGQPDKKEYQSAPGVSAAALIRAGYIVLSSRQLKDLGRLLSLLDPQHQVDKSLVNFTEDTWFTNYFKAR